MTNNSANKTTLVRLRLLSSFAEVCFILSFALIMLNTSLHNKSARLGGLFTYEKFVASLNEAIARHQMPDSNLIKVMLRGDISAATIDDLL